MRISDWSSAVCSSDPPSSALPAVAAGEEWSAVIWARRASGTGAAALTFGFLSAAGTILSTDTDRKSVVEGNGCSVRVDQGGWRNIKKKKQHLTNKHHCVNYAKHNTIAEYLYRI